MKASKYSFSCRTVWANLEALESRLLFSSTIRINVGGGTYKDVSGNSWAADAHVSGGTVSKMPSYAVANTSDDPLYYTRRWGNMDYAIPVTNATKAVKMSTLPSIVIVSTCAMVTGINVFNTWMPASARSRPSPAPNSASKTLSVRN